ncbi:hypothetical protein [Staphylococcus aureus]|uniref:hypothetical protein n=1 Tax=Staphylococcus aureus TaxID=1280 RepID=UPI0018EBFC8E|nr:hypothetical protein [Staphylococcus aureus]MBJ6239727.1 hypothetical protein [Staphylococcus aureus]
MKKGIFILTSIIWIVLIYLSQIIAYALNTLSDTTNKQKIFSDPSQLIIPPAKHPFSTIFDFISDKNTVFFVVGGIATVICIYILIKQLFESKDGNEKNQDYKIAKHGSHGSAKFATDNELFDKGYYKKMKESDVTDFVYKSLDTSKLNESSDNK